MRTTRISGKRKIDRIRKAKYLLEREDIFPLDVKTDAKPEDLKDIMRMTITDELDVLAEAERLTYEEKVALLTVVVTGRMFVLG